MSFAALVLLGALLAYAVGPAMFFTFHGAGLLTDILMLALLP